MPYGIMLWNYIDILWGLFIYKFSSGRKQSKNKCYSNHSGDVIFFSLYFQILKDERYRLKVVVVELQNATTVDYQTSLVAFINCLIISTPQLKDRIRIRNEFIGKLKMFPRYFPNSDSFLEHYEHNNLFWWWTECTERVYQNDRIGSGSKKLN